MLVEAARLAEADGDIQTAAEILGNLDVESLWAGYDWSLHDPRVVAAIERLLAQPRLTARDRTMLTMALAGELTYVDSARSKDLFADAIAMAEPLGDQVLFGASPAPVVLVCVGSVRRRDPGGDR